MTRKFISFLLCFVLVFGLSVSSFAAYEQPAGTSYGYRNYLGGSGSSDFWNAICYSASGSAYNSYRIYDFLTSTYSGIPMIRSQLSQQYEQLYNANNTLTSILNLIPTDYVTASDLSPISSAVSSLNTNWNSVLSGQVGTGVLSLPGIKSTLDSSYTMQSTYLPYILTASNTLGTFSPIMQSIDFSSQSIDSNVSDLWISLSTSTTAIPFSYVYRASPGVDLSVRSGSDSSLYSIEARQSGQNRVATFTLNSISNSNLSLSDRLTALNNNLVMVGSEIYTPGSGYNVSIPALIPGSSTIYRRMASIADFLYYGYSDLIPQVNRLSFIFADDDDIALKNDTTSQRDWVSDYYGSSSAPTTSDYSAVNDSVGALSDMFETGSSTSLAQSLSSVNDNGYDFWSQSVSNEVNNSGTRATAPAVIDFFSDNWEGIIDG